jgi:hypothetical protein
LSIKAREDFPFVALESEIVVWRQAVSYAKGLTENNRIFNSGEVERAIEDLQELTSRLVQLGNDTSNRLEPSLVRLEGEEDERKALKGKGMSLGVTYLDEAIGGLIEGDVLLVGAPPGAGKTQLITRIAEHNSEAGRRVALFALEARVREVERRVKYRYITEAAWSSGIRVQGWSFQDWMQYEIPEAVQFEEMAQQKAMMTLKNLQTYYRDHGEFGVKELKRTFRAAAKDADLLILDHIHYVDVEGRNENAEYKLVIKALKDLSSSCKIPIVVVAHLRKKERGRKAPVISSLDDFHGTSDLVKIATHVVTLGRTKVEREDWGGPKPLGYPTYMRVLKHRTGDGVRVWNTAVTFFHNGKYEEQYAIGEMKEFDTQWEGCSPPAWTKNASVRLIKAT